MKNVFKIISIIFISILSTFNTGCSFQNDEEVRAGLEWWFARECMRVETEYLPITNSEPRYLPEDFYYITDDDREYDLPITWTTDSNLISIVYDNPENTYHLFGEKTYGHSCYRIKVNNVPNTRETINLTGSTKYSGVKYSKTFNITIGDKGDEYIENQKYWHTGMNNLTYLYEYKITSGIDTKTKEETRFVEQDKYYFDSYKYTHSYNYTVKNAYYDYYLSKKNYTIEYNSLTKEILYNNTAFNLKDKTNASDYQNFSESLFMDLENCNFLERLKVLDEYFIKIGRTDLISPLNKNKLYTYESIFGKLEN